ncbi:MAG: RNA polymerase sigma factor [Armatimonadetes bacterium]|nr:RNA polymerase sigma factor [Armatimonadota bacterium]
MTDDGDLVRRTLAGDRAAFEALVERYRDAVLGVAYHHLGHPEEVKDAAQEAFVRAYLGLRGLRDPARFGPWLRRIAANVCADALRARGQALLSLDALPDQDQPAGTPAPGEDVERLAARLVVRQALGRLSEGTRLTVTLAYINGYSHEEVARFLEVPVATVRSRLRRAKEQLREEMMAMVSDELNAGKPGPGFTQEVVEEAVRKGEEAAARSERDEAEPYFDEALAAADHMEPTPETRRLMIRALHGKSRASRWWRDWQGRVALGERALRTAEELGDRRLQAEALARLSLAYTLGDNQTGREREKVEEYSLRELAAWEDVGDARAVGACLAGLGSFYLKHADAVAMRRCYEEALAALELGARHWEALGVRAVLEALSEVGEESIARIVSFRAGGTPLRAQDGKVWGEDRGYLSGGMRNRPDETTAMGRAPHPFRQIAIVNPFLDPSVPVGGSWTGDVGHSYTQRLPGTITVRSETERVDVPAGTFENCLLTELTVAEGDIPDDMPPRHKEVMRSLYIGTRQAWYAPGVGLVQLRVRPSENSKVHRWGEWTVQLKEYSLAGGDGYFPLAVGNNWVYGWTDVPPGFTEREVYRVVEQKEEEWRLLWYQYVLRE